MRCGAAVRPMRSVMDLRALWIPWIWASLLNGLVTRMSRASICRRMALASSSGSSVSAFIFATEVLKGAVRDHEVSPALLERLNGCRRLVVQDPLASKGFPVSVGDVGVLFRARQGELLLMIFWVRMNQRVIAGDLRRVRRYRRVPRVS